MSGIVGTAVSDRMKYGVKQSAVRSENNLRNIKASNGTSFSQALGTEIIFELPASANGTYIDFSKSFFRFTKTFSSINGNAALTYAYERGVESCLRRVQIFDATGTLLENFEHYNECYTMMELMTSCADDRQGLAKNYHEGFQHLNSTNGIIQNYPDLGGHLLRLGAEENNRVNLSKTLQVPGGKLAAAAGDYTFTQDVVFQLSSALFGGSSPKYIPSTSIGGLRFVLTLESPLNTYNGYEATATTPTVTITDPTFFYSVIRVDPMIDASLIAAGRGDDGLIRIHTQRWSMFAHTLPNTTATSFSDEYVIPIRVSSLKGIYFGFTKDKSSITNAIEDTVHLNTFDNMKTAFRHNGMTEYQFFIDGVPSPSTPVTVGAAQSGGYVTIDNADSDLKKLTTGFGRGEYMTELCRALHINQKSADGTFLSLLNSSPDGEAGHMARNMIYAYEAESFSGRSGGMESGTNTLNSNVSLRMSFDQTYAYDNNTTAAGDGRSNSFATTYRNLRVFCLYDCFVLINPADGTVRVEI